ncbi:MAG TPA: D-alanine--D-alanine ligase family protein [Acidimicrobiales bacterium]
MTSGDPSPDAPLPVPASVSSADPTPRTRLVVLFGGQSAEHEVSLVTARHVLAATDPARYDIRPVAITKDGQWVTATEAAAALAAGPGALPEALPTAGSPTHPAETLAHTEAEQVVVFPLLHGPLGEDGTVQGLLELAGVPYVGCGVLASALAMDKAKAKDMFAARGIPQARHVTLFEPDVGEDAIDRLEAALGYPMFVKPANMGSSVGVTKAHDRAELRAALAVALAYDECLVIEETVSGREIECAVLGNRDPRASLPGEIRPGAEFYDYADKYQSGTAELIIPAELPDDVTAEVRALAVRAFEALGCEGMARVDFFYEASGRGLLVNEINTIPGFTPISMYPKMWEATGLSYPDLIDELIRLAVERYDRRASRRRSS